MWTLILVLKFAAVSNVAQLDGATANLQAGSVTFNVTGFATQADCRAGVASAPKEFDGVPLTVGSSTCQEQPAS